MIDLQKILLRETTTLRDALRGIDLGAKGIALVVDDQQRLITTLTDGDMRRAVLAGANLDNKVSDLLVTLRAQKKAAPVTLPVGSSREIILQAMRANSVRQIPLVNADGRVHDLAVLDDLATEPSTKLQAVVMAGGYGKRLLPLTADLPKPMLRVGDRPIIERVVEQLKQAGISRVNISTHYKAEQILSHFGNGADFGVAVEYVSEESPLGTAGALALVSGDEPLLVINGDILTSLDFRSLRDFHFEHNADMTVAVREYGFDVPYGVVDTNGVEVTAITEKPTVKFFVNAGIYLVSPTARDFIPAGQRFDMPQLIEKLVQDGRKVISFPVWEYWLDIGRQEDFERAQNDARAIGEGA